LQAFITQLSKRALIKLWSLIVASKQVVMAAILLVIIITVFIKRAMVSI